MAAARKPGRAVYIATESFLTMNETVVGGVTRVREGHPLLKTHGEWFVLVEDAPVHYDVEAASQAPGEARGDQ